MATQWLTGGKNLQVEVLDKWEVHIPTGGTEQNSRDFIKLLNGEQFKTYKSFMCNFPFNIFGLWVTETSESKTINHE